MNSVCHLTSVHQLYDVRIFYKECISLAKYGFEVYLIAFGETGFETVKEGVKVVSLRLPVKNRIQRIILRTKAIYKKALLINSNIYHIHDPELLPIGILLKKRGKIVIYDAHEDLPRQILQKEWISPLFRLKISKIFEVLENKMAKKMDGIVTVTDHIAKRFIPLTNQVVVCHNYASLSEFKQILHSSTPKTNICYIGGISEIRGIIELIKAAESTEVLVELAGSFDSTKLKSIVVDHSHVVFHGFVNRDEIKEILSRSFAGIVTLHPEPNIINSIPIKMIEYMAAGVAVISSDFEEWKVIIEDNNAGLCVNPMDVESISNAISFLKKNPKTAIQMGKNGRKAFKNKYNWQKEEKKLIELYFKLLNDNLNI